MIEWPIDFMSIDIEDADRDRCIIFADIEWQRGGGRCGAERVRGVLLNKCCKCDAGCKAAFATFEGIYSESLKRLKPEYFQAIGAAP